MAGEGRNRRAAVRVDTGGSVAGQLYMDLESDVLTLSPGGMMIELEFAPPLGSKQRFILIFQHQQAFDVTGVVRNVSPLPGPDGTTLYAIGIEFESLEPDQRAFLETFLARQSKP